MLSFLPTGPSRVLEASHPFVGAVGRTDDSPECHMAVSKIGGVLFVGVLVKKRPFRAYIGADDVSSRVLQHA